MTDSKKQQHYLGHRQRIKKHFLNIASEQVEDSELLEIMLFMMYSRKDVKPLVKKILHNFGNLRRFFATTKNGIQNAFDRDTKYEPCSQETIENLYFIAKLMKESTLRMTKQRMDDPSGTIFHNFDETIVYLQQKFGNLLQEHFTVIFLNAGNRIIDIITVAIGTIDEVRVYDREIVTKAISIGCVGLILVHNHFSGNPEASQADKDLTLQVAEACDRFQIKVLDHVIITNNKYFSFKENGLQLSHIKNEN